MKNKLYLLALLFLVCILSISAISATENTENKDVISVDNNKETNLETNIQYDDVSTSKENCELNLKENNNEREDKSGTDEPTTDNEDPLTFTDLNNTINGNKNSTIYLSNDYKFNNDSDYNLDEGVKITRDLEIYGNGITIDANNMARIFNVVDSNLKVNFYNINFINGNTKTNGGAIFGGNAYNCNFTNNTADQYGGAIFGGNAYNCNFTNNTADQYGGALTQGNATNCTFTNNTANQGGAIYFGAAHNCTFTENKATNNGGAIYYCDVYDSTFTENRAENDGGAIYYRNAYNCTFTNNTANQGGALASCDAYNCTFTENKATTNGGAIYEGKAYNCIFNKNKADNGGAIQNGNPTNCTFNENEANLGGAMAFSNAYDCTFTENKATNNGGATYESNAYNCTFFKNEATRGGAMCNSSAYNCNFTENKADKHGGAIHQGNATNCTFTKNEAEEYGGAIYYGNVFNCIFQENNAGNNGGAINQVNATNCKFTQNKADDKGGAIDHGNATNCTFEANNADKGGAIYEGNAYNCTFDENEANNDGGAIHSGEAHDCTFSSNLAEYGGATYEVNAYNCKFNNNFAVKLDSEGICAKGGAMYNGNAYNCTFQSNVATHAKDIKPKAGQGGAIYEGNAYNCIFISNQAAYGEGGAMFKGKSYLCRYTDNHNYHTDNYTGKLDVTDYNSTYQSGERLKFKVTADDVEFDDINTLINISKADGSFVKVVYGLSGEGWIVDLEPGEYTAKLNLMGYDDVDSETASIKVSKGITTVVIDPIIDVKVGKEITITYNTNSNGTVTIKVNGQEITDGKFTPTAVGTYNVTIDIAENPYYLAGSNETTFTAEKTNTTIVIDPIIDAVVGKEITIKYKTNSNETATIKVNGQEITGGKFTPTAVGTYNVTIDIAENPYYTAGSNETTFTVGKAGSKIIAKPVTTTYNVGKYLIITLKDSNNKPINGALLTVNLGSVKNYKTDKNGQIKINVATLTPKTYNAKITYKGSDIVNGSTGSVKVTVKKATPKITAKNASYKLKLRTKKYIAIFKDNKNKVLKNTRVTLKVNGKTYAVKTNSKGQATFKITNLKRKGTYTAVITFPANKYYNKVTKRVKIAIKS